MSKTDPGQTPAPPATTSAPPAPDPVGEPPAPATARGPAALELETALAMEAAQKAVNCPTPPTAQAVIDAASPDELAAGRAAITARLKATPKAARGAAQPKTPE